MRSYLMKNLRLAKEETVPLPFSENRAEKRNLGKALGEGLGLLKN